MSRSLPRLLARELRHFSPSYAVELPAPVDRFPPSCPYCGAPGATERVYQRVPVLPGRRLRAFSGFQQLPLPACPRCARRFRLLGALAHLLAATFLLELLALVLLPFLPPWIALHPAVRLLAPAALLDLLALLAVLGWRRWLRRRFRVAWLGTVGVVYASTRLHYARAFAALHGTEAHPRSQAAGI